MIQRGRGQRLTLYLFLVLVGLAGTIQGEAVQGEASTERGVINVVDIDGVIGPGTLAFLEHGISVAAQNNASALIVRLDTPGGLLSTTRDMVHAIAESPVPIIAYVGPAGASATSAGAFILLSAHVAVMNAGTNVGASSPVSGDGGDIEGTMGKKVMNDTRAFMRSVAESHNRNAEVAEAFVSEARSLAANEALKLGVVDAVVPEFLALPAAIDGREINFHGEARTLELANKPVQRVEPRLLDRLLNLVAHPRIAHLLISLGMLAIYVEIYSPGLAFPGIFGAIALILGFVGVQTLPVDIGFLLLLVLGIILMIAEFFVAGFGVLGIGGAIAFILGSINLFDAPIPQADQNAITTLSVAVSGAIVAAGFLIGRGLWAGTPKPRSVPVGKTGEAMVNMAAEQPGHVLVAGERWEATCAEPLRHGDPVVVLESDSAVRLRVKRQD